MPKYIELEAIVSENSSAILGKKENKQKEEDNNGE